MKLTFRLKRFFFNAFREFFVQRHSSLEFRAKIYALMIASKEHNIEDYVHVRNIAMKIYKDDEDRANLLTVSIRELIAQIESDNKDVVETLIDSINLKLKHVPRYAKKIDTDELRIFIDLYDADTISYQENILEFLQTIKDEILESKEAQIRKDEELLT